MTTTTCRTTIALALACLALNVVLIWLVAAGEGRLLAFTVYLLSLGTVVMLVGVGFVPQRGRSRARAQSPSSAIERADLPLLAGVMAIQLAGLIYMSTYPFHYVQDEFITGYTSYMLPSFSQIEWFAGYPQQGEWIAKFPILYYALQKPFISLLGLSLETIRISTWPYHLLTAALVYLIGKECFRHRAWAFVAATVFILLAPNLYMAGYGMHNISSTFFFLAAFYSALRMLRSDNRIWIVACGLFTSMAYLTYTSSYLTVPLLAALVGLSALFSRSVQPLIRFGQVLIIALAGLIPFITHAINHHNYFTQRGDQVNAISHFSGGESRRILNQDLIDHIQTNIKALYTPGIGGVTDYWFGHQALFDWFTLLLLIAGLGLAIYQGIAHRESLKLTMVVVVLTTFAIGMFLTMPAGGFHRTTLAFPFVALLLTLTLRIGIEAISTRVTWRYLPAALAGATLAAFILINVTSLDRMTREDEQISGLTDSVPIHQYVEDTISPGSEIIISSFPNYHLERELIVRTGDDYRVRTEPFERAAEQANDTVIILFQPGSDQTHRLEARSGGTFIDHYNGQELQRHLIWVPKPIASH